MKKVILKEGKEKEIIGELRQLLEDNYSFKFYTNYKVHAKLNELANNERNIRSILFKFNYVTSYLLRKQMNINIEDYYPVNTKFLAEVFGKGEHVTRVIKVLLENGIIEKKDDSYQAKVKSKQYRITKEYLTDSIDYVDSVQSSTTYHEKFFEKCKRMKIDKVCNENVIILFEMLNLSKVELEEKEGLVFDTELAYQQYRTRIQSLKDYDYFSINCITERTATNTVNFNDNKLSTLKSKSNPSVNFHSLDVKSCLFYMLAVQTNDTKLKEYLMCNDIYVNYSMLNGTTRDESKLILLKSLFNLTVDEHFVKILEMIGATSGLDYYLRLTNPKNYKEKARQLQSLEASKFNDLKAMLINKNIFYLSKYDSLIVEENDVEEVFEVMQTKFEADFIKVKQLTNN